MTLEELHKIGKIQLEIMDKVHSICVNNNITYYMIAGTLLGAVRHGGFIPWDLDIDIGMPRKDYERFKAVCAEQMEYPYAYLDHTNCRMFVRPHALICRTDTKITIQYDHLNPKLLDLGIYLDVFPLDNAPEDPKLQQKQAKRLTWLRKFKGYRIPYCYCYKTWKRYAHYTRSALLSWVPVRYINQIQQKQMKKYSHRDTGYLCSMASRYAYKKQCMDSRTYGKPVLLEFEGRRYYAPENYKEYLTQLYGDYMQLPPLEKRNANLQIYTSVEFPVEAAEKG